MFVIPPFTMSQTPIKLAILSLFNSNSTQDTLTPTYPPMLTHHYAKRYYGKLVEVPAGCRVRDGLDLVENYLAQTTKPASDLSYFDVLNGATIAPDKKTVTLPNSNSDIRLFVTVPANKKWLIFADISSSIDIELDLELVDNGDGTDSHKQRIDVTNVTKTYMIEADLTSSATFSGSLGVYLNRTGNLIPEGGATVTVENIMLVDVTSRPAGYIPPYVSVGVGQGDELWDGLLTPVINNAGGSSGDYDDQTLTASNTVVGTNASYPRFRFFVPGLKSGDTFHMVGQLSGDIDEVGLRLAVSGGSNSVPYSSLTGEINGVAVCSSDEVLELSLDGTGLHSVTIESLSIKNTKHLSSNIDGAAYFDHTYPNATVDGNGVVTMGDPVAIDPALYEGEYLAGGYNQYLAVTQNATVTESLSLNAGTYTCWMEGAGSVTLSGGASGVATENNPVTFTLSSTQTVTHTYSGDVDLVNTTNTSVVMRYTDLSSVSATNDVSVALVDFGFDGSASGKLSLSLTFDHDGDEIPSGDYSIISLKDETGQSMLYVDSSGRLASFDGTSSINTGAVIAKDTAYLVELAYVSGGYLTLSVDNVGLASIAWDGDWDELTDMRFAQGYAFGVNFKNAEVF